MPKDFLVKWSKKSLLRSYQVQDQDEDRSQAAPQALTVFAVSEQRLDLCPIRGSPPLASPDRAARLPPAVPGCPLSASLGTRSWCSRCFPAQWAGRTWRRASTCDGGQEEAGKRKRGRGAKSLPLSCTYPLGQKWPVIP